VNNEKALTLKLEAFTTLLVSRPIFKVKGSCCGFVNWKKSELKRLKLIMIRCPIFFSCVKAGTLNYALFSVTKAF
jgi:hypothetical protein